jgi:hypothetical protein
MSDQVDVPPISHSQRPGGTLSAFGDATEVRRPAASEHYPFPEAFHETSGMRGMS